MNEVLVSDGLIFALPEGSVRQLSVDGKIPVEFAGCSCEGNLYEDRLGRLFLVRYSGVVDRDYLALVGERHGVEYPITEMAVRIG